MDCILSHSVTPVDLGSGWECASLTGKSPASPPPSSSLSSLPPNTCLPVLVCRSIYSTFTQYLENQTVVEV